MVQLCDLWLHAGIFSTPVMWKKKQCYVIIYAKKSSLWSRAASNISRAYRKPTETDEIANRISCARWENYTCVLLGIPLLQPTVIRHFAAGFAYIHIFTVFSFCVLLLWVYCLAELLLPLSFFASRSYICI